MKRCSVKDINFKLNQYRPDLIFPEANLKSKERIEAEKQSATRSSDCRENESVVKQAMDLEVKKPSKTPREVCALNAQVSRKLFVAESVTSAAVSDQMPRTHEGVEVNTDDAIYRTVSVEDPDVKPKWKYEVIKERGKEQSEDDISDGQAEAAHALVAMMNRENDG